MKRTIRIRGYVAKNGQVSLFYCDGKDLKDHSDAGVCADSLPPDQSIREIAVTAEIDVEAVFRDAIIPSSKVEATGAIEEPLDP